MRKFLTVGAALVLALAVSAQAAEKKHHMAKSQMKISSTDLPSGKMIGNDFVFKGFGCEGGNMSPELTWSGAPEGTKSLALTMYDPDAPTGSGFWHWLVINMPPGTTSLARGAGNPGGALPPGSVQIRTDFGQPGYGGPCPPKGDKPHRYVFTIFAVDQDKLDDAAQTSAAVTGFLLHFHTLAKASFTAKYGR
jgi:Raf kinase inhibitor-like YbhB/YbcL family protein